MLGLKLKKRTAMIVSFAVGTLLFATTALAEIATKSGYDQAKDAVKTTSDSLTNKVSSYTMDMSMVTKNNGSVISSQNTVNKYDLSKKMHETTTIALYGNDKSESLFYRDKENHISYNSQNETYYVAKINSGDESFFMARDPFKEKQAQDIERIIDAFVGNLKDYVVVSENSDGSKELSGSLNETQIPALVNAIVSYQVKNQLGYRQQNGIMPRITQDVFVKEVKGKLIVDKDGIIQSVLGTAALFGKDDQGAEHNITVEILGKVSNINSTVVKKPDLTGKKVEESVGKYEPEMSNPELYVGTYKNNIVVIKDNKFVKIGERVVEITQVNSGTISGSYREEYLNGYEEYSGTGKSFSFNAKLENGGYHATFDIPKESGMGQRGSIGLDPQRAKISFYPEVIRESKIMIDGEFNRVFE
jgi:hypothetical protein